VSYLEEVRKAVMAMVMVMRLNAAGAAAPSGVRVGPPHHRLVPSVRFAVVPGQAVNC